MLHWLRLASCVVLVGFAFSSNSEAQEINSSPSKDADRPRARELGIKIGVLKPGEFNAITDVEGVMVGHRSLIEGDDVRTGVTTILPHGDNLFQSRVPAAIVVGNGFGKLVGSTQVQELGEIETPIALTSTLSTFTVADALVKYTLNLEGNEDVVSVNPIVGECNDAFLNDIRAQPIQTQHVFDAIEDAKSGPVKEGCVGAGVGTRCLGWKGGIGTSSRIVPEKLGGYTVGVLVQTNFGGRLTVDGIRVGEALDEYYLRNQLRDEAQHEKGSCIMVVATDAPLDARQLRRLASRALLGIGAIGSPMTHGSGDYVIAFSVNESVRMNEQQRREELSRSREVLHDQRLSPLFEATREATEEALLNSLLQATTTRGFQGREMKAISIDQLKEVLIEKGYELKK